MGPGTGDRIAFGRRLLVVEQPAQQLVDVLLRCRGTSEFVSRNQVFQRPTVVPLRPPMHGALVWTQRRRPPTLDQIGRASCRERVGKYVYIMEVDVTLKQKSFIQLYLHKGTPVCDYMTKL